MANYVIQHLTSKDALPWLLYYIVDYTPLRRWLSDKVYLKIQYRCLCRKPLNLKNPQSFNEKLQWLKIYNRNLEYSKMVDKYEAKKYVASIIGEKYIIPTLGVWDSVDDIDWDSLPNQFVLKCTHDSGGLVVCRDKSKLDKKAAIKKLKASFKVEFYYSTREWPYKNVKPRVIAEKYMEDSSGELTDYKYFCFDGEPKAIFIASDRLDPTVDTKFDFFDMDFNHLDFRGGHPNAIKPVLKPAGFEHMKDLARKLSQGIPHVRVDFYDIDGHVYFGELTFFHWGGMAPFDPEEWNYKFGEWIKLPNLKTK